MKLESTTATPPSPPPPLLPFAQAISAGDLDSATSCFARDGCLITPDATAIYSRERIRPVLLQLIARRTEIAVELSHRVGSGEVVLVHERWRVRYGGLEGRPQVEQTLSPTLVLHRVEGEWKLAIAAPWRRAALYD